MNFESSIALLYHTYNSLFLSLPFQGIEETGTQLALFGQHCKTELKAGKDPVDIVESFWQEYFEKAGPEDKITLLFYFIRYIERQVVLFDSVEDAQFEQTHEMNGPGSLKHLLNRVDSEGIREKLLEKIKTYSVRLVLTAHPTQFYPGKVLGIINDLGKEIQHNKLEDIRLLLMQLGKTTFFNRQRPTPYDEALSLSWYLEHIFFNTLPDILFRLLRALDQDVCTFENPSLLALGFWPGGDRDGNPFVNAETTQLVAARLREVVLRGYHRDVRELKRRLTFRGTEDWIAKAEMKINNTLYHPDKEQYQNCQELLADLQEARQILVKEHQELFLDELDLFILKIRIFGFYFASMDIRQDSRKHGEVWEAILKNWNEKFPWFSLEEFRQVDETTQINRLLSTNYHLDENDFADPFVKETIRSFGAVAHIQQCNGEKGCHRYIISNCQSALNVAEVLALARLTLLPLQSAKNQQNASATEVTVPLDIVPLFETIDDLAACGTVMEKLYTNPHYAAHLAVRGKVQHIMLGFSDGTKDGGYLRANWSIYLAKEELTRVSRQYGVTVIFFDGRGGPPGRGGGNNVSYYASHGKDIENHAIQVTIQGQTVSSTYGTRAAAIFNTERLFTAGLGNYLFETHANELTEQDHRLMNELADAAYHTYLDLKNDPAFVPYLEKMTPLKWYGDTNIASRPTKRSGSGGLRFEDLRAIPFVGAWAQMKQNIPGYHGVGGAIASFKKGKREELRALYHRSLFFRTLLENSMQSLAKSNFDVTRYLAENAQFGSFWQKLYKEYQLSTDMLRDISGQELLSRNAMSRASISIRENIVLPLIVIQQFAMQRLQDEKLSAKDVEIYQHLVLRAMFGIINAARNAA